MKTYSLRWLSMALVGLSASFMLMACQKDSGGSGSGSVVSSCGTGLANSQYGCIPTAGCSAGMGMYQNQCVVITNTGSCAYGSQMMGAQCLPSQGSCGSGLVWNGSQCIWATTGQAYPQNYYMNQQYMMPIAQPYPLYGGYYGYGQVQPMPMTGSYYGGGGVGFSMGLRF